MKDFLGTFWGLETFAREVPLEEFFVTFSLHEANNFTPTLGLHLLDACILGVTLYFVHSFNDI